MKIIAYTYEADVHCVGCSIKRFGLTSLECQKIPMTVDTDQNGIPIGASDSEGNTIHPIFSTDEQLELHCGDCRARLICRDVHRYSASSVTSSG